VIKLDFKGKSLVSNVMFTWFMEFYPRESVGVTHPVKCSAVLNWEQDVITCVKENNRGWVISDVGRIIQVKRSSRWAGFRETDW
jgi:hypothetical protein